MKVEKSCARAPGRPRGFDADAALDAALAVFWRKGYEGASLADLTAAMGINRPSLYAAYGNKEALFRRAVLRYLERTRQVVEAAFAAPTARDTVAMLLGSAAEMESGGATLEAAGCVGTPPTEPAGCLLVLGALTCSDESESVRRELAAQRLAGEVMLRERFERAQASGELPAETDCADLARFYTTVHQGLSVQASGGATSDERRQVVKLALRAWPGV